MAEIKLKAIPSPSNLPPEIQAFAGPVKEAIDVLLGRVGSGADAALTRRSAGKIVDGSTIINAGTPSSGGYIPDLTPPPAPTGLVATPGFSVINLEWNDSPYSAGHGHSHTVIYRSSDSLRGNAVQIGMTPGTIYVDAVGSSAGPFFYWIRYVTRDGVMGPWNSAEGVSGATAQDPEFLLDQLYGRIRESELTLALQNRISLVDGVGPGSVSARILAEAQARDAAIIAESTARQDADLSLATSVSGVSAGLSANSAAITQESQARATADGALASQISALASRTTSAEASIVDEQTARTSADSALSASISSVSSTVQGHTATITSQAESIDGLKARYTLQFDVNGRLSGWGAQAGQGGTEFTFLTDRFSIASPDLSGAASRPFVFQAADEVINGVTIPAGVYIDTAYMARFVARKGQIGSLAVDDASIANISAAKLTIGDGTIGGRLKSAYFASGVAGWQIHPDGTAEFNNVLVRGTVYAESGYFKGTLVGGAATAFSSGTGLWAGYHSGLYKMHVGNPTGAGFTWDGSTFTIRGANGSVLLASGSGVPYDKVSGVPTSLSEINSGEATKLAGIQAGATVGADASNLSVGLGVNLLFNTEFSGGPSPATQTQNPGGCAAMAVDSGKAWIPPGVRMLYIDQGVRSGNAYNIGSDVSLVGGLGAGATTPIPVIAGRRYEFSAIMAVSYCDAALHVVFYDAANNSLLDATSGFVARAGGGAALSSWTQGVTFATAPAGAVYAVPYWRRTETDAGQAHSYARLAHPYFGEALASQTGASVYAPGGVLSTNQLVDGAGLGSTALWSGVSGAGKPQDNATVGAAFGDNISGQISASNVSTYIAGAAIGVAQIDLVSANRLVVGAANIASAAVGLAQIDLASANKLVVGTANIADAAVGSLQLSGTIQSDNFVTGSAGWQIRKSDGWAEFQGVTVRGNVYDTRPYTVGNTVLIGHPTPFVPVLPNSSTPVKCKEIMVARTGTVRVYAEAFPGINWTSAATHVMYVKKNGTTVTGGFTLWLGNNTDTTVKTTTVDVSVSPGDLISVWLQSQPLNGNGIQNMRLMAGSIYYESITY